MSNDAAILGRVIRAISGECRVCHCHGDACSVGLGEMCVWMDGLRTLCSNPKCLAIYAARKKFEKRQRRRRYAA